MFKKILGVVVCVGLFAVSGFLMAGQSKMPEPEGAVFWTYITKDNPYHKWHFFPGKEGLYEGKSPHGAYLKVYVNDIAYKAASEDKPMPYGAIIVKENYGKDKKTLMAITPMYKVEGFNPEAGDWFWAKYGPSGKVMAAGKVKGCIKCHSLQKDKDWRFLHFKKK